jgi:hypothetical protein
MSIHSRNNDVILQFGLKKPAFRIVVNTPTTHGSIGLTTGLDPAMTLGCGGWGGHHVGQHFSEASAEREAAGVGTETGHSGARRVRMPEETRRATFPGPPPACARRTGRAVDDAAGRGALPRRRRTERGACGWRPAGRALCAKRTSGRRCGSHGKSS